LSAEINKGYEDIKAGRIQTAEEAFDDIRKEFNI
jgi:predicted transcriptional regulator